MTTRKLGIVVDLRRYLVKSMAAELLSSATVTWHGIAADRRWAFVRPGLERSGFPWLTIREKPDLWRYQPRLAEPGNAEGSKVLVKTPGGGEWDAADPELARELGGEGIRVIKQGGGIFDTFPVSLLTLQSVRGLSELVGEELTAERFRPNLVVDAAECEEPFPEDAWVGSVLRIGTGYRCRMDVRDPRCVMVNVDPQSGAMNPAVLRAIATEREARFGVYGTTVEPGEIAPGDEVWLETR